MNIIPVDVPIGLLSVAKTGGRSCDVLARKILGFPRSSSVGFSYISDVLGNYPQSEVQLDDIIDAAAACCREIRILKGGAIRLPARPERDTSGLFTEN